jgi:hypothetical protein
MHRHHNAVTGEIGSFSYWLIPYYLLVFQERGFIVGILPQDLFLSGCSTVVVVAIRRSVNCLPESVVKFVTMICQ